MPIKKYRPLSPDPYVNKIKGDTEFARLAHLNDLVDQVNNSTGGGSVQSVTGTDGVSVDNTDATNPIVKLPYKSFIAILQQTGTSPINLYILQNDFGITPVSTYSAAGSYTIQFPGLNPVSQGLNKTYLQFTNKNALGLTSGIVIEISQQFPQTSTFDIISYPTITNLPLFIAGVPVDNVIYGTLEIRIYP